MSVHYVVPSFDRHGEVVEVYTVEAFFDLYGQPTDTLEHAVTLVAFDGTCRHKFPADSVYFYPLH